MAKVALLIGVSEYETGLNPLPGAVKDVEAMQRVLGHPEMGGFAEENITVLKNPQRQAIEDAIYRLFDNRQKDDLLLFYFSGHGVKDESGKLYLSTCKTRKNNGKLVKPSAVAASTLHESINESKSQRQVVILDCCFSGAIAKGMTIKDDGSVNVQEQLGGKGRAILTSSTSTQYSFEQENSELSIYTQYMVEGIEKGAADLDDDGWISVDELHDYASSKVREAAPAMTPEFYPVQDGYRIRLAKSPKDDPKVKYRKEVEGIAFENEGEISPINRSYLNELRNGLRLQSQETDAIESEVLEPYRQRREKLQRYEQIFTDAIRQQYPLSKNDCNGLKRLQQTLRLRDEDVALIERRIVRQRQRFSAVQLLTRQQFLKLAGLGGAGFTVAMFFRAFQGNSPPKPTTPQKATTKKPLIKVFDFDVVTVGWGKATNRKQAQAKFFSEYLDKEIALEMVSIPGGKFLMGSPESEQGRSDSESPQHSVTIQPFFMGKFAVTQAQWHIVAGLPKVKIDLKPDPSNFKGANRPVEGVSWHDAVEFCGRLSKETGHKYRLPSEAEWEYACRAGTTTPFHFGKTITTDLANYNGNEIYGAGAKGIYREQTRQVGSFPANPFGLYDMHGNVWEWCADHWYDSYERAPKDGSAWIDSEAVKNSIRVLRGGSWSDHPGNCRSACRLNYDATFGDSAFGFRVVCAAARTQ
jgi:formylglycine-generating enzyme required for sulfatase activity/uncharacterized caspase-like protein